jgi:transcriptional regulator with XRE-family HTH domain
MGSSIQRRTYERAWKRADYKKNPEKYRARSRTRRRLHGAEINRRRRQLYAQESSAGLEQRAARARAELGRTAHTLNEWFQTQAKFSSWAQFAREMGVSRRTVHDWRIGAFPPARGHRRRLYELTGLRCFADAAGWRPRETSARRMGEEPAVRLLADLVVRCGLATRELQRLRVSQIEEHGLRLAGGRFISFGEGWEQVSRGSLDDWLRRARPAELLFYSRRPVDRGQPVSRSWISRVLKAGGIQIHRGRTARIHHFAGDFKRLGDGGRFVKHLRRVHGLSRSGARGSLCSLRNLRAATGATLRGVSPERAWNVLCLGARTRGQVRRGRPRGMTRDRIAEALRLSELIERAGGKRGSVRDACRKVYSDIAPDLAYDRGRQTLREWKRAGSPRL